MAKRYETIADELRSEIQAGMEPGTRLPAETALTERFNVSLATLRQALSLLEAEGFIERRHGRGTFVRKPRVQVRRTNETYQWEKDRARLPKDERYGTGATEQQTGTDMSDLEFFAQYGTESATEELASQFGVPVGTKLLHRVFRTKLRDEDEPLSLIDSYLVYDLAAANPELLTDENEPWPGGTQSQLYTIGIEVDRITEEVTARPPLSEEAEKLGLPPGTAVLALTKKLIDVNGNIVEISKVVLPGDRTVAEYTTPLTRWES